jgi:hypothetical protein
MHVMTIPRRNGEDSPLNAWIRKQSGLDSSDGYVGTDVDMVWYNYKRAFIMLLEQKEYLAEVKPSQEATLSVIDQGLLYSLGNSGLILLPKRLRIPDMVHYCGCHLVVCQHTNPEDGDLYVDGVQISIEQFLRFLRFEWTPCIQVYREQCRKIYESWTMQELDMAADFIRGSIYSKHPEAEILRSLYRDRKHEIEHLKQMFPCDGEEAL